jgi:hypothetical protein
VETVTQVIPRNDFHLELEYSTGEVRVFDARPYLDKGAFRQLHDLARFKQAYVAFETVCWPGNLDIAPETLYDKSVPRTE